MNELLQNNHLQGNSIAAGLRIFIISRWPFSITHTYSRKIVMVKVALNLPRKKLWKTRCQAKTMLHGIQQYMDHTCASLWEIHGCIQWRF